MQLKAMLKTDSVQSFCPRRLRSQNIAQFKGVVSALISLLKITGEFRDMCYSVIVILCSKYVQYLSGEKR